MPNSARPEDEPETFAGVVVQSDVGRVSDEELDRLAHMVAASIRVDESRSASREEYLEAERRVATNIRDQRVQSQMSQEHLAMQVSLRGFELHQSTVAKIESGKRPLRIAELFAFADALGVPWTNLLEGGRDIDVFPSPGMIPLDAWEASLESLVMKRNDAMAELIELVEEHAKSYADWDRMILVRVAALANAAGRARSGNGGLDEERVDELVRRWNEEASGWAKRREAYESPSNQARIAEMIEKSKSDHEDTQAMVKEFLRWRAMSGGADPADPADTANGEHQAEA